MCDLVWSDPDDRCGWGISPRGAGYTFGQVRVHLWTRILFRLGFSPCDVGDLLDLRAVCVCARARALTSEVLLVPIGSCYFRALWHRSGASRVGRGVFQSGYLFTATRVCRLESLGLFSVFRR